MANSYPKTFDEAVATGLLLLDDAAKAELSRVRYVDPHTKYRTDFISAIGEALGISDGSNNDLQVDVLAKRSEELHFLEVDGDRATQAGALRLVLREIARACGADAE